MRPEDVEDLAQEAFIKAFAAESSRKIRFPKAFLFKVARNLALNERTKAANATTELLEDLADPSVIEDVGQMPVDEEMAARRQVRLLAKAVANLPPQCSRVFVLRKLQGLSYKEIAARLNISVSTVEKHVALGLLRCSDYLRQQGYEVGNKTGQPVKERGDDAAGRRQAAIFEMKRKTRVGDE